MKKKLLVVSFSYLDRDPRVRRQISALKDSFDVVVAGFNDPAIQGVSYISLQADNLGVIRKAFMASMLVLRLYEWFYWSRLRIQQAYSRLKSEEYDFVLANDLTALPLCLKLSAGRPLVFDAHEFAPAEYTDKWYFRWFVTPYRLYECKKYIKHASAFITVAEGIADLYATAIGLRPQVVMNAAEYSSAEPEQLSGTGDIRLIHHGAADLSRRLERMIDMMSYADERFSLTFMLVEVTPGYLSVLKRKAKGKRIDFIEPVAFEQIIETLNKYDMGVYLLPPMNMNARYALPNKLFEFVQARLGICIGPSIEMARIVRENALGVVSDDMKPESMARKLNAMTIDDVNRYKQNAHASAKTLSFESEAERLRSIMFSVLPESGNA